MSESNREDRTMGGAATHIYACLAIVSVLMLAALGRLSPNGHGDTWAYALAGNLTYPQFLTYPRTPFYGWFLRLFGWHHAAVVPLFQVLFFVSAVGFLIRELRYRRFTLALQIGVATACLFSTAFIADSPRLLPELIAISFGIFAFSGALAAARGNFLGFVAIMIGAGVAYLLRPIFLPMIFAIAILLYYFSERLRKLRYAALGAFFAALPFLGYSTVRASAVGDFNVVSFGGFQASGMAALMLDDGIVSRLDADNRSLAASILNGIRQGEKSGAIPPVPVEIDGERSFKATAIFYPDVFAAAYDSVNFVVSKQKKPFENEVAFDQRLLRFDIAVIKLAPVKTIWWIAGQTARLVGQGIVTNTSMGLALLLTLVSAFLPKAADSHDREIRALVVIILVWSISSGLLAVSASFAATRYINTATIFFPALPAYWALKKFNLEALEANLAASRKAWLIRKCGARPGLGSGDGNIVP